MKILVVNGSPKGKYSITLQTINYLEALHPEHTFEVLHVGQRIKSLEKDFSGVIASLEKAELVLFSYPVYTFIAPSQLHRFIELVKEADVDLGGKFVTQITTSKHFYDVTAHRYIEDNCKDLGMKYIRGLSADMDDLLIEKGQKEARDFFDFVCFSIQNDIYEPQFAPVQDFCPPQISVPLDADEKSGDVVIVTDCKENNTHLKSIIDRFRAVLPRKTRIVNIGEYKLDGGCLGCFHCASDGKCIYKDGFDEYLRGSIQTAEAIVYAFTIKDHSMGARFKMYDDRQFCNGHRTVTMGMPMGYLVSGNLESEPNLQTILTARADVGSNFLCGTATDEKSIDDMAKKLVFALENKYVPPQTFYGVGGMKIFRDLIYLMRGMMKADHRFYKKHGQYDFPQKKKGTVLKMYLVGALISNKKIKAKMGNAMNEGMLAPYNKLLEKVKNK